MGRHLQVESEVVVYLGMRHLIVLEGIVQGTDVRVNRYVKKEIPQGFQQGLVSQLGDATKTLQGMLKELFPDNASAIIAAWIVLGNLKLRQYSFQSSQYYQGDIRLITSDEIHSVIQQTRTVATLPLSEFVLQTLPDNFMVDDVSGVRNPMGLEARRLGVNLKIFTMNFQEFKNLSKVFDSSDLEVTGYIPKGLTISQAVLSDVEKTQGALVLDMTSENTEVFFWKDGAVMSSGMLDFGGKQIDTRLSERLGIDLFDAERLKKNYAAFVPPDNRDELIPLINRDGRESRQIKRSEFQSLFSEIAVEWLTGLLGQVNVFIQAQGSHYPHFIFTGGGASIDGFIEFLYKHFSLVARIGLTKHVDAPTELLVDPSMTHALGMFRWIATSHQEQKQMMQTNGFLKRIVVSARDWFLAYF
ncbi:MAG: hypothetical protein EXS63_00455 [Candidatus Omnitrophica bacterium]|nr:hypothetical protein [Candidatus Omnitrophota bacterium]